MGEVDRRAPVLGLAAVRSDEATSPKQRFPWGHVDPTGRLEQPPALIGVALSRLRFRYLLDY